jgi:histidinol-phosphate aminotransferase
MKFDATSYLRKRLLELKPYQSARQEFVSNGESMIFLDANESPYETDLNRYPDPLQLELKALIAKWKGVRIEQLYLSNGSDEFISQVIMGCCEPEKEAIMIAPPTFGMYKVAAALHGVQVCEVPLTQTFELDVDALLDRADETVKILFIANPNNPTANAFKPEALARILDHFPGLIVIDEAYSEFHDAPSYISQLDKYPNLLVCQTFSKAQGLAGARLGIAYGHPDLISFFNRVKAPYNINTLTLSTAIQKIDKQEVVKNQVKLIIEERKRLEDAFSTIECIQKCYPSDANFLLIQVDDAALRYKQLIDKGIVVRNTSKYLHCENTLRITVGLPEENQALIKAFQSLNPIK